MMPEEFELALLSAVIGIGVSAALFRLVLAWPGRRLPPPVRPPVAIQHLGFLALALHLLVMLAAPLLVAAFDPSGTSGIAQGILLTVFANLAVILIVFSTARLRFGLRPARLGLHLPSPWALPFATLLLGAALPAFLGASLINFEIARWLDLDSHQELVRALMEDERLRTNPLVLIAIVLVVPLLEEVLFRGFVQSALRVTIGPVPALLAASLLFAILHDIQSALPVFVVGLTLGAIFERTGSVWASAGAHALFNGLQIIALLTLKGVQAP